MDTTLRLKRRWLTDKSSVGELFYDNSTKCEFYTLEDRVREMKVPKITAIPEGMYELVISFSKRFQKLLPLLIDVPNYEGVRIHSGNKAEDTEGCILLGMAKGVDSVYESRAAMGWFMPKLLEFMESGKVFIEIKNEPVSDTRTKAALLV